MNKVCDSKMYIFPTRSTVVQQVVLRHAQHDCPGRENMKEKPEPCTWNKALPLHTLYGETDSPAARCIPN